MRETKVANADTANAILAQQMQELYSRFLPVALSNAAAGAVFVALLWKSNDTAVLLNWLYIFLAILVIRIALFGRNGPRMKRAPAGIDWSTIYVAGVAATGLMWGSVGFLFMSGDPLHDMIITIFVLGISMGSIAHISRPALPVIFVLSCNVPLIVSLLTTGGTFHISLASLGAIYLAGFAVVLFSINRMFVESIDHNVHLQQEVDSRIAVEEELMLQSVMLNNMTQGVYMVRMDGEILFANPRFEAMFGYDKDELVGQDVSIVNYPTDKSPEETAAEIIRILDETGKWEGEVLNIKKDGTPFWTSASVRTYEHPRHGKVLISVQVDITERREGERRLGMLSQVVEQTNEAVAITDRDAIIQYINPAFTSLTGYSAEEARGQNPRILKSGKQDAEFYREMWATITQGRGWQSKVINKRKDGSLYPAILTISPIMDKQGEIINYAGIQQDLTEIQSLESQLMQAQKMEALGTLVGGIAHEFNNSLSGVISSLYLAKLEAEGNPVLTGRLETIERISFDSANLIKSMLQFARKGILEKVTFNLGPFISEILKLIRVSLPENIELVEDIKCNTCSMEGDINLLQQVILNVLNNSRDALVGEAKPRIMVRVELSEPTQSDLELHPELSSKKYAVITINDNGCGMNPDLLQRAFEPFQTTKEVGKGTGLGLSMSYGVVRGHGGLITMDSVENVGTGVRIFLPVLKDELQEDSRTQEDDKTTVQGKGELILLVDDNEVVLRAGRDILVSLGYRVLSASSGESALEEFKAQQADIDLVLTDVIMPGMSGVQLISEIRKLAPDIKFILSSGYDRDTLSMEPGFDDEDLIEKPFRVETLSKAIGGRLGNKDG